MGASFQPEFHKMLVAPAKEKCDRQTMGKVTPYMALCFAGAF